MAYLICISLLIFLFWRFLFSIKSAKKFPSAVLPTLNAMKNYLQAIRQRLQMDDYSLEEFEQIKVELIKILSTKRGMYPEWVYRSGFNPGLRAGARSFLIQLERVIELLFAIEFILFDETFNRPSLPIADVLTKNEELIAVIENYFLERRQTEPTSNLTNDIHQLEESLNQQVPGSLELLDLSPEYLQATALVRNIKDMRQVLLALISALPA